MTMGEPPARRRGAWWRWPLLGCVIAFGVAVGIIVASVSCLAIVGYLVKEAVEEEEIASSLSLGQAATIDGLRLTVDRYELSDGSDLSPPRPGAQFLLIHLRAENVGQTPIDEWVNRVIEYRGQEVHASFSVDRDRGMFDPFVKLFPGIHSEGWALFEVPVGLDLSEVAVVLKVGLFAPKVASWRLAEPENANGR